jgi:Ca2+-binding RTX toxin-like protein
MIEGLESRRLLSIARLEGDFILPDSTGSVATDVAVAANGESIVVGAVTDPMQAGATLKAWRFGADGVQIGEPLTLDIAIGSESVSVSMDADGDAVVAYQKTAARIYFVRISRTGVVSAPVLVREPQEEDGARTAAVSMDAAGDFFIAQIINSRIEVQRFTAAGATSGASFAADTINIGGFIQVDIAAKPDGSGAVVGYSFYDAGAFWNVRAAVVSTTARVGPTIPISSGQEGGFPSVATSDDGSFVVGYKQFDSDPIGNTSNERGFLKRFNAAGEPQGAPVTLGDGAVTVDDLAGGGFVAFFADDGVQFGQRFDESGTAIDAEPSTISVSDFVDPNIASDASGVITLAYVNNINLNGKGPLRVERLAGERIALSDGLLSVIGTGESDSINIQLEGASVIVSVGSTTKSFAASAVNVLSVYGLLGNDTITNETLLKATLRGNAGDDTIFGGADDDRIHGGSGNDSLWGRDGVDRIYGEDGIDSCYGNGGNDRIEGGAQPDHIRGNGGRDKLFGNGGNDKIYGGESGDWIYGQPGRDEIWGEGGNDRLYGDDGEADILHGNAGDDVFITLDGAVDDLFGDGGRDSAYCDKNDLLISIESIL